LFGFSDDVPSNYVRWDELFEKLRQEDNELHKRLARFLSRRQKRNAMGQVGSEIPTRGNFKGKVRKSIVRVRETPNADIENDGMENGVLTLLNQELSCHSFCSLYAFSS